MSLNSTRLLTASLRSFNWGERASRVIESALRAVDPREAVQRSMAFRGDILEVAGRKVPLGRSEQIYVVGAGKAGAPMARAVAEILGERVSGGVVIVKDGYKQNNREIRGSQTSIGIDRIEILEAGHPIPDRRGVDGSRKIAALLEKTRPEDLVICLISGGGSALLPAPIQGVTLKDIQRLTSLLLACGATINEINSLRKHLDKFKGGGLARLASPARVVTLILSDVVGDPLDVISSGPTVPDSTTFRDAYGVLERYGILDRVPKSIVHHLMQGLNGKIPETPKEEDLVFRNTYNVVIGNNRLAAQAAMEGAVNEGFHPMLLTTYLQGEARQAGRMLAAIARQIDLDSQPLPRPACLIVGGETTVTVTGNGRGGRNQELALGAVSDLSGLHEIALVTLATDGGDGPTDAAGAVVTGDTLRRALSLGMEPSDYLRQNNAYTFFEALGDLLKPGPTQTNVNDLAFLFAF